MFKVPARSSFANKNVVPALARMAKSLLQLLADGSFAERERQALEMTNEIGRLAFEHDCRASPTRSLSASRWMDARSRSTRRQR